MTQFDNRIPSRRRIDRGSDKLTESRYLLSGIKHYMNPLHIYCRLRDIGIAKGLALFMCRNYERSIFKLFLVKKL
ncbi:MAG: hypothetical protein E3J46_00320 [Desulfobacteraceae bacterium]|nr:MAG: hypothetical protein E3J46_00320 [Desulfobacteraceae bacterium]